ncbi:unnamed protein product [marine sediment metagenome]|uniref:Uncharacterized protein n=1 Tax=marine sediment metagenome TaxID=412755 RepID=X1BW89_9ZZZZ
MAFTCLKGYDNNGEPIYGEVEMRYFLANCPKINQLCSSTSGGYVAAVTVCNQRLFV